MKNHPVEEDEEDQKELDLAYLKEIDVSSIQEVFDRTVEDLQTYHELTPLFFNISVSVQPSKNSSANISLGDELFNWGVQRTESDDQISIIIGKDHLDKLPLLILREAYKLFYPFSCYEEIIFRTAIYMLVLYQLRDFEHINQWKHLVMGLDEGYLQNFERNFDTLIKFFQYNPPSGRKTYDSFLCHLMQKSLVPTNERYWFESLTVYFLENTIYLLLGEERLESLWVLSELFNNLKTYRALADYKQKLFEFKEEGIIDTQISVRTFTKHIQDLVQLTWIAPSYVLNWAQIGVSAFFFDIQLNPILTQEQVHQFWNDFPFHTLYFPTNCGFSSRNLGWVVLPEEYESDLRKYVAYLQRVGFATRALVLKTLFTEQFWNINLFRSFAANQHLIHEKDSLFDKKYLFSVQRTFTKDNNAVRPLTMLDFVLLDHLRYVSLAGFGFEKRQVIVDVVRSGWKKITNIEINKYEFFEKALTEVLRDKRVLARILSYLNRYKSHGFLALKNDIDSNVKVLKKIRSLLIKDPHAVEGISDVKTIHDLCLILGDLSLTSILKTSWVRFKIRKEWFPLVKNKSQLGRETREFELFLEFLNGCEALKMFEIKDIIITLESPEIQTQIQNSKRQKLEEIFNPDEATQITLANIEHKIDEFLSTNPPTIIPSVGTSSISYFLIVPYGLNMILRYRKNTKKKVLALQRSFMFLYYELEGETVLLTIRIPSLTTEEEFELYSLLYNIFGMENVISLSSTVGIGLQQMYSLRDFYDFANKQFHYSESVYEGQKGGIKRILRSKEFPSKPFSRFEKLDRLWSSSRDFSNFIQTINYTRAKVPKTINKEHIKNLMATFRDLRTIILDSQQFTLLKNQEFFDLYVDSVYFEPDWGKFGLEETLVYINPFDSNKLDFRLLFMNTFQTLQFSLPHENDLRLIIKYAFPRGTPNLRYFNELVKSWGHAREYCVMQVKKTHHYLNLQRDGYLYDPKQSWYELVPSFVSHVEKVLFKASLASHANQFSTNERQYGPESRQYSNLTKVYSRASIDYRRVFGTKRFATTQDAVQELLSKHLIFPYLKFKNLQLNKEYTIILPDVKKEFLPQLISIFSYFNLVEIKETYGQYSVETGTVHSYSHGLMIRLWFPPMFVEDFFEEFEKIFQFFEIAHPMVFYDLFDGELFLKHVFSDIDLDSEYHPLKTMEWNDIDKKWINPKLYGENMVPRYPPLHPSLSRKSP